MIKRIYISLFFVINLLLGYAQDLSITFSKINPECALGAASITIVSGTAPIHILWSNNSIANSIEDLNPGHYFVKVNDDLGHDTTINFTIDPLVCEPIPQNHFTPNNDGYNDTWNIQRLEKFPDFELFVYNRWGQQVHHQFNEYIPWDGRSLTLPLPDATYYYILYLSRFDKNKFIKGDISILR
jgi:gliding motility-associated-like protein